MKYCGFEVYGQSGDWTATSSDVEATGRTKNEAVNRALKERNALAQDAKRDAEEERKIDHIVFGSFEGNPRCTYCGFELDDDEEGDMHYDCSRKYNRG